MPQVERIPDEFGATFSMTCKCGKKLEWYVERGASVSSVPAPFPDDVTCEHCTRSYNSFGQEIDSRWEFDPLDAGESWDEE